MRRSTIFCGLLGLAFGVRAATPPLRLPGWVVPVAYRLDFRVDPADAKGFSGHAEITIDLRRASDRVWLNGQGLAVDKVVVTGADGQHRPASYVAVAPKDGVARIDFGHTLAPQRLVIGIDYRAWYVEGGAGAFRLEQDGRAYVATDTEPLGSRTVFPGFDEPGFKTPYTLSVTVPRAAVALANTRQTGEKPDGRGWKTVTFATTRPLPTYLVAFAVGPWALSAPQALPPHGQRRTAVPLRAVTYAGQAASMRRVLAETPGIVEALEDYYGAPYPWDKLDLLDIDGGMENPGLVALGDLGSSSPEAPARAVQGAFDLAAHELAHQWTGDLVTMAWWDDLWLNESLAVWMQQKLSLQLHPDYRADLGRVRDAQRAMAEDALASARQVRQPIAGPGDIANAFDGISYFKGAAVLGMFEYYMGEKTFRQGMRDYIHTHAFGSATASDLVGALVRAAGNDDALRRAFHSFIDQPGVPYLRTSLEPDGRGFALRIEQGQYRPLGASVGGTRRWEVPVCVRYQVRAKASGRRCLLLRDASARLPLPGASADSWVMPNADARGYYRFGMDAVDWKRLAAHVESLNEAERLAYADAVAASFHHGDSDAGDVLAALRPLTRLDGKDLAATVLDQIDWIWWNEAVNDAQRRRLEDWVRQAYLPRMARLGYRQRKGEPERDGQLRALLTERLALVYRLPEVRSALLAQGDQALTRYKPAPDFAAVDRDLLRPVFGVTVQERGEPAVQALGRQLFVVHDVAIRQALVAGLGYADTPALARRVRDLALDPRLGGGEHVNIAIGGFDTRAQRDAMWQWFDQHHRLMLDRLGSLSWMLPAMLGQHGCSRTESDRLQRFFAPMVPGQPALARSLAKAQEAIRLCSALRQAQDPRSILH